MENYKVSVLLALYNPNKIWLVELLKSLNEQTYKNIELIVYDDCPEKYTDESIFEKCITAFPYKIFKGKINKGSNKAFEYLTEIADGDYFAYCDQDDVWHRDKISEMVSRAVSDNAEMVCCDLAVIDGNSRCIYNSYRQVSKRHIFQQGRDVYKILLVRNFAVGCATLYRAETAKKAIPFCQFFFHDHWLAIIASLNGYVSFIDKSLIDYRIHANNQTGVFLGINDKEDYFENRIDVFFKRTKELTKRLSSYEFIKGQLKELNRWAEARFNYYKNRKVSNAITIYKYRKFGKSVALFEILMPYMPDFVFKKLLKCIKKGKL